MVVIVGSKTATPSLVNLVSNDFKDLTKFYKNAEIDALQSWISKQPHLPKLSDDQVLVFLHATEYSAERAKELIDTYYTLRTRAPDLFGNRNPTKVLARAFTIAYFVCMPENAISLNGNQIVILKLIDTDPANSDFVEGVKTTFALMDLMIGKFPLAKGVEIIMDMEGLAFGHLARIDFTALRVFMEFCQNAIPARLKAVHVVNTFSLINQVLTLIKPFINIEFFKKISFYTPNEFTKLTNNYIPLDSLPSEYGGKFGSMNEYQEKTFKEFLLATDWFEEIENYKVIEAKRVGRKRSDLNVCDGSFRKLELD